MSRPRRPGALDRPDEAVSIAARRGVRLPTAGRRTLIARRLALAAILAGSGFAGLAEEIVWTRMLAGSLGTEMNAVLGVVTGFFAGLGLGALTLDRLLRRAARPNLAYAALEMVVALWTLVSIWLLPASGRWLAVALGPQPAAGVLSLAGFAFPALALLPATAAMGGTLIALERWIGGLRGSARVVAGVYGANTLGAALGCLLGVFALLPSLGLSGTLAALAGLNLLCACGAVVAGPGRAVRADEPGERLADTRLWLTLAGTGLLGIAVEIAGIRLASQLLQNTIYSMASLLGAYLLGTALGGLAYQRFGAASGASTRSVAALLVASSASVALIAALVGLLAPMALAADLAGSGTDFVVAGLLFLLPAACMGALFSALAQAARLRHGTLGWALGVNSLGAALAPALTARLLIPGVGTLGALTVVALGYLLFVPLRAFLRPAAAAAALAVAVLAIPGAALVRVPPDGSLVELVHGPAVDASVVRDAGGDLYLEVNGHMRMGGTGSQRSDWRQAALPLLLHPDPHAALFLGVGTGATVRGAASVPGLSTTAVELLPEVTALLPRFADPAGPAPTQVIVADARRFVLADERRYDVIVADLFHPAVEGTGSLYTREHFAAARERLAPGGLFCQWLPLYQLDRPSLNAILRTFLAAFPDGSAWLAHLSVETPMLALIGGRESEPRRPEALQRRLADPALQRLLQRTGIARPLDLTGLYVAGPDMLARLAGAGPLNTDDMPLVALDARRNVAALRAAPTALLLGLLADAGQAAPPSLAPDPSRWRAYRQARDGFLRAGAALPAVASGPDFWNAAIPSLLEAVRISPEFDPAYLPLLAISAQLLAPGSDETDRQAGQRILQAVMDAAPTRTEASQMLARLRTP